MKLFTIRYKYAGQHYQTVVEAENRDDAISAFKVENPHVPFISAHGDLRDKSRDRRKELVPA